MTELDDRLREHFSNVALDDAALARIHAAPMDVPVDAPLDAPSDNVADVPRSWWTRGWHRMLLGGRSLSRRTGDRPAVWMMRYAALALVLVTVGVSMRLAGSIDERGERAMREVAMNHATRLTFEFEGESLAALDARMDQLPFEMSAPARLPSDVRVLGSRYCSLSGQLAAHIKLRDADTGRPLSLFVTSSAAELHRLRGESGFVDGVRVELFSEGGLFYALARQAG